MKIYLLVGLILLFLTYSPATTFARGTLNCAWDFGKQIFSAFSALIIAYIVFLIYYLHYTIGYYFAGLSNPTRPTENIQHPVQFEAQEDRYVTASGGRGDNDGEYYDFPEIFMPEDRYAYATNMNRRRIRRPRMLSTILRDSIETSLSMTPSLFEARQALYEQFWTPAPSPTESRSRAGSRSTSRIILAPRRRRDVDFLPTPLHQHANERGPQLGLSTNVVQFAQLFQDVEEEESITSMPMPEPEKPIHGPAEVIILHQFPRGVTKPCLSIDGMHLETFIRLTGIPYNVIFDCRTLDGPFITWDKGQGTKKFCGVNDCIAFLKKFYHETTKMYCVNGDLHVACYSIRLTLDHLACCLKAWRWVIENAEELRLHQPGWNAICKDFDLQSSKVRNQLWTKGFGNKSDLQLCQEVAKDFGDLSTILGSHPFLLGEDPTEIDCTAFGILCQVMWGHGLDSILKKKLEEFANLVQYCNRVRQLLWPDWNEHLSPEVKSQSVKINHSLCSDVEDGNFSDTLPTTGSSTRFCTQYYQLVPEIEDSITTTSLMSQSACNNSSTSNPVLERPGVMFGKRRRLSQQPHPLQNDPVQLVIPDGCQNYIDDDFNDMQKISYSSHLGVEKDEHN